MYGPPPGQMQYQQGYPPQTVYVEEKKSGSDGIFTGLLAGLACCCCLDCLF